MKLGKVFKSAVTAISLGTINLDKGKDKVGDGGAAEEIKTEAEKTANQRKRLFLTQGGASGEQVGEVFQNHRGSLWG